MSDNDQARRAVQVMEELARQIAMQRQEMAELTGELRKLGERLQSLVGLVTKHAGAATAAGVLGKLFGQR